MSGSVARPRDEGSILPLAIGFSAIAIALIVVGAIITDIYLVQKRLMATADSAATAAADSFTPGAGSEPSISLSDEDVRGGAEEYLARTDSSARFEALAIASPTGSPDGQSARVTLEARATPVLLSPFVPEGVTVRVTATVRGSLRLD